MIYLIIMYEFFKIGLFSIGGGLVTIPFLFDLSEKYHWYNREELADIIGVSQSLPGALGVNLATFAGIKAAGTAGGIIAALSLSLPSVLIIIILANVLRKYRCHVEVAKVLTGIKAAVVALILTAIVHVSEVAIVDIESTIICILFFVAMWFYKKSPVFYIALGAVTGLVLNL